MLFKKRLSAFLLLAAVVLTARLPLAAPLATTFKVPMDASTVFTGRPMVIMIGTITPEIVDEFIKADANGPSIRTLAIDSGGGDVLAAIRLADFVRERRIHLIVEGRCFSACANYVFSGARTKDVMPGSLVAIHSSRYTLLVKGNGVDMKGVDITGQDSRAIARAYNDPGITQRIEAIDAEEKRYMKVNGLSRAFHQAFSDYEVTWTKNRRPDVEACPRLAFWVLDQAQLEEIGIRGIHHFWWPSSGTELKAAAIQLGAEPEHMFFGSASKLKRFCRGKAAS
jgi:ATP-dependent protease ClpP protease subunit